MTLPSDALSFLQSGDVVYFQALYDQYKQDPASVDAELKAFFEELGDEGTADKPFIWASNPKASSSNVNTADAQKAAQDSLQAIMLIRAYRVRGHLMADLDPLGFQARDMHKDLDPATYGFSEADFNRPIYLGKYFTQEYATVTEIINGLKAMYCGHVGTEYMHIQDPKKRLWIQRHVENGDFTKPYTKEEKLDILDNLIEAEGLEHFLQVKFTGTKRFGLEGGESIIPALQKVIENAAKDGIQDVNIGMSHRGRLNVLTNVMGKSHVKLFSQFQGLTPEHGSIFGSGDVKYHLGMRGDLEFDGKKIHLSLNPNPSHLEAVDPVVVGKARAKGRKLKQPQNAIAILLHGDAAFAGQGVVSETFLLSAVPGYTTRGTLHYIVNNQIGFTTNPSESRSSPYCTDIAKMVQAPIFHVNGDNPEAVQRVCEIALDYRQEFLSDVVIDMFCYRRHGHNESDEPAFTQPLMYERIKKHKSVLSGYMARLASENILNEEESRARNDAFFQRLEKDFDAAKTYKADKMDWLEGAWSDIVPGEDLRFSPITGVSKDLLKKVGLTATTCPKDFNLHPRLARVLKAREEALESGKNIDWATAESMAFGTLLNDGRHVRLSGQDCERGTFSQRHAVFVDQKTNQKYAPLNNLQQNQGFFEVLNSPLSEMAVLGFEYGYSLADPHALVLWEAQFGDFANGAQVIVDQFISAGEHKWMRMSGLVMLLPHGYEGQGPEHSSARLERYLQLCAENNIQVANCSTPANYFHILRRQLTRSFRKPLIMMTPKSLLRLDRCVSTLDDMGEGTCFKPVIADDVITNPKGVKRVVICSGKIYYDLEKAREEKGIKDVAIVRLEQFYPYPEQDLTTILSPFRDAEFIWCQEEPLNMGAWHFIDRRLENTLIYLKATNPRPRVVARPESASTAVGYEKWHRIEQEQLLEEALVTSSVKKQSLKAM